MAKLSRRDFLKATGAAAGAVAVTLLSGCAPVAEAPTPASSEPAPTRTPSPTPVASPTPTATPGPLPSATPYTKTTPELLGNENRNGAYIRYYNLFEPVDLKTWALTIEGLVEAPRQLSFDAMLALPQAVQTSRLKCVEGWSYAAKWHGFRPQVLVDLVKPKSSATWVSFRCADDYFESMTVAELLQERVLFVYGRDDALLAPEYGAPLRLIIPFKYGYKGPKALTHIAFSDEDLGGFWSTYGAYTKDGQLVGGVDLALDLDTYGVFDEPGEIFYEEGRESQGP